MVFLEVWILLVREREKETKYSFASDEYKLK